MGGQQKDNWLITGTKNGTISDSMAIQVYDNFDFNHGLVKYNQDWLNRRINRSPNNVEAPIDWLSLGFDQTKAGPQRVTYFVTDSQKQATTTSRWVDKLTDQTVKKDSLALECSKFCNPVRGIEEKRNYFNKREIQNVK